MLQQYWLSVYQLYRPKILVSAIGNITKCILVTKILHFYGKIGHKIVRLCTLKGKKFEQSCILDRLSVSADISDPLSVIGISAKFHIGASLVTKVPAGH